MIACVNHDAKAIKSHWRNHPHVRHFEEDIRTLKLKPLIALVEKMRRKYPNAKVILWASLECTNFSKAKGGQPRDADSRTLADHLDRYIIALRPDLIQIENVVEFMSWGPLDANGKPVSRKSGSDWLRWREHVRSFGYFDDWKEMNSADYGAFTSRNRLFGIFAKDQNDIIWPEPTHAKNPSNGQMFGAGLEKWKACRPCLDLDDHGNSIFTPGKIKSEKTFERVLAGCIRFIAGMGYKEFISKYYSGKAWSKNYSLDSPGATIRTVDGQALVQAEFLVKQNSTDARTGEPRAGVSLDGPAPVIPTQRIPNVVHTDFLSHYYGTSGHHSSVEDPSPVIPTKDRTAKVRAEWIDRQFGVGYQQSTEAPAGSLLPHPKMNLVQAEPFMVDNQWTGRNGNPAQSVDLIARMDKAPPYLVQRESGQIAIEVYESDTEAIRRLKYFMSLYGIVDIKMRMLKVQELKRIQGFPENYILEGNQSDQKKFIGNSVVPHVVKAWTLALGNNQLKQTA